MQVSKRWRIWLGICVAVTVPLLMRDLHQITSNPPILQDRLPSSLPVAVDSRDIAVLPNKMTAQLIEVRAPVPGGYAGWAPIDDTLPETSPTHGLSERGNDRYGSKPPAGKQPHRFSVDVRGLPKDTLRMAITDESGVPDGEGTTSIQRGDYGKARLTNWLLLPRKGVATDVYVGFARAADRRILTQIPLRGEFGFAFGEKSRWLASPDGGYTHPLEIELPTNRRPRVADQYFLEVSELDAGGNVRMFNLSTVSVTPTTERLNVSVYGPLRESHGTRAIRVTLTPYRWARFADVRLAVDGLGTAKLHPRPIPSHVERVRSEIADSPGESAFYEVGYATRKEFSHLQVARYVPDSIVLTVTASDAEGSIADPSGSDIHVYLPKKWGQNYGQMAMTVTKRNGRQVEAIRGSYGYVSGGKGFQVIFRADGVAPEEIDSILFGLRH